MKNVKKVLGYLGWVLFGVAVALSVSGFSAGIRYNSDLGFYDKDDYRKTIRYYITKDPEHLSYKFDHLDAKGIYERMICDYVN